MPVAPDPVFYQNFAKKPPEFWEFLIGTRDLFTAEMWVLFRCQLNDNHGALLRHKWNFAPYSQYPAAPYKADEGVLGAPPHDSTGYTWHHPKRPVHQRLPPDAALCQQTIRRRDPCRARLHRNVVETRSVRASSVGQYPLHAARAMRSIQNGSARQNISLAG
jgi:hypothetical protein